MSSLFADAMRAAVMANVSGFGPMEPTDTPDPRDGLCNLDWDWDFPCGLPKGHEGDHLARGDDWEMRWRNKA